MPDTPPEPARTEHESLSEQERYWYDYYRRWENSGLSLAAYARSQGLVENTFYGWHAKLKKRGLAKPEPAPTVFHRVIVKPTEVSSTLSLQQIEPPISKPSASDKMPAIDKTVVTLRFRLPNGIDCEFGNVSSDNCAYILASLAHLRP